MVAARESAREKALMKRMEQEEKYGGPLWQLVAMGAAGCVIVGGCVVAFLNFSNLMPTNRPTLTGFEPSPSPLVPSINPDGTLSKLRCAASGEELE